LKLDSHPPRRRTRERLTRSERMADIMRCAGALLRAQDDREGIVAEIAAQLGIVEGTIYRYFPTKRDLIVQVAEDWYEGMLADYDRELAGISGTQARLRFMVWRHLTVMHDEPAMCRLVLDELRADRGYRKTSIYQLNRQYTQRTLAIIKDGIASGELRADVPLTMVRDMIYGGIEHHTWAYLRGEGTFSPEQAADEIIAIVYRGIAAPQENMGAVARLEDVTNRLERLTQNQTSKG
jgi:TetR/AcrR family fatty acid metabolism transcriptional regulator